MKLKDSLNTFASNVKNLVTNTKATTRIDGWSNILSNINTRSSRTANSFFMSDMRLQDQVLNSIYNSDGIARRIIDIIVDDSLRGFIECDKLLLDELKKLKVKQRLSEAASYGRLFGGCILVAFIDDGQDLEQPLNLKGIKKVVSFRAFDRSHISWMSSDLSINYYEEHFGEPNIFTISPPQGQSFKVHRSRCHIFGGDKTTISEKVKNKHWDNSVLQSVYESLRNYGIALNSTSEIIQDFIQTVLSVDGLTNMLMMERGDADIIKRLNLIDQARSVANTMLIDAENEKYEKKSSSVAGLSDLIDRYSECVCAVTGIPASRLFGRSPAGLNASGESDIGNWHDIVEAYRSDEIEPAMNWVIKLLTNQKIWNNKPKDFEWSFPALKTPNELEWANIKQITAKTDETYITLGAVDATTMFKKRYDGGIFNTEISIEKEEVNNTLDIEEDNQDLIEPLATPEQELINKVKNLL